MILELGLYLGTSVKPIISNVLSKRFMERNTNSNYQRI
jgi:hypothetical protein